jgi:hypothetical protein
MLITHLQFPDHWKIRVKCGKEAVFSKKFCGGKKASFWLTKQTLSCQITGHLSCSPSKVACQNEKHHENVEGAGCIGILILQQVVILLISV